MKIPTADRYLKSLPTQLKIWSPTSLASYMACPRRYFHQYGEKWEEGAAGEEKGTDLTFGGFVHDSHDVYLKSLASGADTERATELAVDHALKASWGWGGEYRQVWRCDGKIQGKKGRPVKCPYSKQWNGEEDKVTNGIGIDYWYECPSCRKQIQFQIIHFPNDKIKNRHTLVRSVVALCDELSASNLRPVVLPSGEIGAEYPFLRPLSLMSPDSDLYQITGSFDGIATVGDGEEWALPELKTTRREPNQAYFNQFLPGVQFYTYSWAAAGEFPGKKPRIYLIVLQVGVGFSHVIIRPLRVPLQVLEEWEKEMVEWITRAERDAWHHENYIRGRSAIPSYPRNPTACHSMPGAPSTPCPFLEICSLSPSDRGPFLRSNFHQRTQLA